MKPLGFVALASKTEKKKAAGNKIAEAGMQLRTIAFNLSLKLASSTYLSEIKDKTSKTPACACPALNKSCLNLLAEYAGSFIKNCKRVTPPYNTVGIIIKSMPASFLDLLLMIFFKMGLVYK